MAELLTLESLIALLTLTTLEIVLGVDNIVFIAILTGRLPASKQAVARRAGLAAAMLTRILLLLTISWVMRLTQPLFSVFEHVFSGRDLILLVGGLFLLAKSTHEIHDKLETERGGSETVRPPASVPSAIAQIMVLDLIFSLDSVVTAVGMAEHVSIMVAAIVIAVLIMMLFAGRVSRYIEAHPTTKMLALSFLLLIGVMLVAEGFGRHIPKGYIYFAMGFSLLVEMLNLRVHRPRTTPPSLPPHASGGAPS
ncbi:MAG: TerC family protein [Polyangiaceae bacterium]|nr:TerC family protein [Polyangiaceae bacterium]